MTRTGAPRRSIPRGMRSGRASSPTARRRWAGPWRPTSGIGARRRPVPHGGCSVAAASGARRRAHRRDSPHLVTKWLTPVGHTCGRAHILGRRDPKEASHARISRRTPDPLRGRPSGHPGRRLGRPARDDRLVARRHRPRAAAEGAAERPVPLPPLDLHHQGTVSGDLRRRLRGRSTRRAISATCRRGTRR